jgi:hypothetical protein
VRSDEFDKRDASAEIESNNHPKIAASDFESGTLAVQDFRVSRRMTRIIHRTPLGSLDQRSPTVKRCLGLGMPLGVSGKHAPSYNSHGTSMFPNREQRKVMPTKTAEN